MIEDHEATAQWIRTNIGPVSAKHFERDHGLAPDGRRLRPADEIAALIDLRLGGGGANFPGATELYEAVRKITAWRLEAGERDCTERLVEAGNALADAVADIVIDASDDRLLVLVKGWRKALAEFPAASNTSDDTGEAAR